METASTVVIGYPFVTSLSFILSCQGRNRPFRTDLHCTTQDSAVRSLESGVWRFRNFGSLMCLVPFTQIIYQKFVQRTPK
jgi:hypothetical protein